MTGTEVATTTGGFQGADVDGLDKLAHDFTAAAQVVDMVKTACEIIVAAASFFGPFAAAFIAYLKGTVIPWLTKISEALKAMSKVLSLHSAAQKDTSSSSTSLPTYTGTTNLPTTSTTDAPQIGGSVAPATPTTNAPATTGATVTAPPTIGGSVPAGTTTGTTGTGTSGSAVPPIVSTITALTGLVTAVDHLIHPGSSSATPGATTTPTTPVDGTVGTVGGTLPGTVPTPTTPVDGTTPAGGEVVSGTGAVLGSPGTLGGTGGIDLSTLHPLHPGDTVGVISVPVDISPDGKITPLVHTPLDPTTTDTTSSAVPAATAHTPAVTATPLHSATPQTLGSSGGGSLGGGSLGGGGSSGGGGSFGGGDSGAPVITSAPPAAAQPDATLAAHTTPAADPALQTQRIGSHDGLFSGLGQATGIGAGAAALARAVLHEAKQRADGSMAGATASPFDAGSDGAAQSTIFSGAIG